MRKLYSTRVTADDRRYTVVRDSVWNEYRVRTYEHGVLIPEWDYFTSDKEDACSHAIAVSGGEELLRFPHA